MVHADQFAMYVMLLLPLCTFELHVDKDCPTCQQEITRSGTADD